MQGAKKGLIVNSRNLCFKPKRNRALANLSGHNSGAATAAAPAPQPLQEAAPQAPLPPPPAPTLTRPRRQNARAPIGARAERAARHLQGFSSGGVERRESRIYIETLDLSSESAIHLPVGSDRPGVASGGVQTTGRNEKMTRNLKTLGLALVAVFALSAVAASGASAANDLFTSPSENDGPDRRNRGRLQPTLKPTRKTNRASSATKAHTPAQPQATVVEAVTVHPKYEGNVPLRRNSQ